MLQSVKWFLIGAMGICIIWLTVKMLSQKSFKKIAVWCCISGLCALLALTYIPPGEEGMLPINGYTLGTSCILGVPGVVLLMLTKILWQLP